MKIPVTFLLALFLVPFTGISQQQLQSDRTNEIIVQLEPGVDVEKVIAEASAQLPGLSGLEWARPLAPRWGYHLLSFDKYEGNEPLAEWLARRPGVVSASWNKPLEFRGTVPNDPLFDKQWHIDRIGAPGVWDISVGGQTAKGDNIVVAVLEKGFDHTHEDLIDNIWTNPGEIPWDGIDNDGNGYIDDVYGWNFRNNTPFFSIERHGTNVLGIIGGRGNNDIGISGVNMDVKMMLLSVNLPSEVIAAFDYIIQMRELYHSTNGEKGAFIVATNGSFGFDARKCSEQPVWGAMYDPLGQAGILSVAATANQDWDVDDVGDIPTSCPSEFLLSVTSTDTSDIKVSNAAFGKNSIDLAAPGRLNITTDPFNQYYHTFGGTSSACPHVSGAIALLYSLPCSDLADLAHEQPAAAARLVRDAVLLNVDPLPTLKGKTVTGGRLNVFKSMEYLHAWCVAKTEERAAGDFTETYLSEKKLVRIFPNPVSGMLTIEYGNDGFTDVSVKVFNALGQEMDFPYTATTRPFEVQHIYIDVSAWSAGTYFVKLLGTDRKVVERFIKI